jgi:hypothetical protein
MVERVILQTFRYTFHVDLVNEIGAFSKIHQFDDRKTFKESWNEWLQDDNIRSLINNELKKMRQNCYEGDLLDKLYKSARYYHRKKKIATDKPEHKRKDYESLDTDVLETMDNHVRVKIKECLHVSNVEDGEDNKNIDISKISPADSFMHYCEENQEIILNYLWKHFSTTDSKITKNDGKLVFNKFKKTYKNRFYNIRVNIQNSG